MPALPALLGRGKDLAGPSGFWVGHSSERFTVGLMSDREPGLCARLSGIHSVGAEWGADEHAPHPKPLSPPGGGARGEGRANALLPRTGRLPGGSAEKFNPAIQLVRASPSCRCVLPSL